MDNRTTHQAFEDQDEALLNSLADYAAVALENASLYQKSRQELLERERVEAALRVSEQRYALAVSGANDGLWDWDMRANRVYYSPRWKTMLGYVDYEISDAPNEWFQRVHPDDLGQLKMNISAHIKGLADHFECEYRMRHKDVLRVGSAAGALPCGMPRAMCTAWRAANLTSPSANSSNSAWCTMPCTIR